MEELGSSELGTHEYWEKRYKEEIKNFTETGDPGEIWFGEDIVDRIMHWLTRNATEKNANIIDIGCGNGHILIELANEGYANLTGVDYSEEAIKLANAVKDKQDLKINYFVCDVLKGLDKTYDIIHDKGTYDAISLSETAQTDRKNYIETIHRSLDNGFFIITSCNWTQSELEEQFANYFILETSIPTPQFKFGGKVGSVVSICVFKKKNFINKE